jgi:hypothetical protein
MELNEIMNIVNSISLTIIPGTLIFLILSCYSFYNKDKIYRYHEKGWMDVNEYKIPEDIKGFLATDGKKVQHIYYPSWGPHGKVIFNSYDKTYVTHWQPLPSPPKE